MCRINLYINQGEMAGNLSAARDLNKDNLINELVLNQVSNTTIYVIKKYT
jgi:hypothetical protein